MSVHYKIADERIAQQSPGLVSKKAGGFLLCHFSHAEDLIFGIKALQSFHIPIHEVYTPVYIEGLRAKLEIKKFRMGYSVLKYGCFGGASLSPLFMYVLNHDWNKPLSGSDAVSIVITVTCLMVAFLCASWLMAAKPPAIVKLPANDHRFAIVVKTKHVIMDEGVASFLQYSGAVEITQAVKRMLAC